MTDIPRCFTINRTTYAAAQKAVEQEGAQATHPEMVTHLKNLWAELRTQEIRSHHFNERAVAAEALMNKARELDRRRIAKGYGPRRSPGVCKPSAWLEAVRDELREVEVEMLLNSDDTKATRAEIGDVLANVVQLALVLGITDPLEAAVETCDKVQGRLDYVEAHLGSGKDTGTLWREAKVAEKNKEPTQ